MVWPQGASCEERVFSPQLMRKTEMEALKQLGWANGRKEIGHGGRGLAKRRGSAQKAALACPLRGGISWLWDLPGARGAGLLL